MISEARLLEIDSYRGRAFLEAKTFNTKIDNKHLMTGPKGNSEFCFPETLKVCRGERKLTVSRGASH